MFSQHKLILVETLVWYRGGVQINFSVTNCTSLPHVLTDRWDTNDSPGLVH